MCVLDNSAEIIQLKVCPESYRPIAKDIIALIRQVQIGLGEQTIACEHDVHSQEEVFILDDIEPHIAQFAPALVHCNVFLHDALLTLLSARKNNH